MNTGHRKRSRSDTGGTHEQRHKQLEKDAEALCKERELLTLPSKMLTIWCGRGKYRQVSSMPTGFPDLYVFGAGQEDGSVRHGLAVEFKIGSDTLKLEQQKWKSDLRKRGIRRAAQDSNPRSER